MEHAETRARTQPAHRRQFKICYITMKSLKITLLIPVWSTLLGLLSASTYVTMSRVWSKPFPPYQYHPIRWASYMA